MIQKICNLKFEKDKREREWDKILFLKIEKHVSELLKEEKCAHFGSTYTERRKRRSQKF